MPETTAFSPVVEGRLPDALTGTLFRHGPNPLVVDVNNPNHSWFAGDGMVHLTTFEAGTVRSYRSRTVRTSTGSPPHAMATPSAAFASLTSA